MTYGILHRITCFVKFKSKNTYSDSYLAILDTGAHTSLIPNEIWKNIETEELAAHYIRGIIHKEECTLPVKVAKVKGIILDSKGNQSGDMKFHAFLCSTDDVPLILGIKDLLSEFKIVLDVSQYYGYLEVKT
ncbi:MAG: hypothetical protein ACE5HW_04455 [Candidatus Methanofastidiosia archaeon]